MGPPERPELHGHRDEDPGDEIDFHIQARTERLIAEGWEPEAARREAIRRFGDVTRVRGEVEREMVKRDRQERRAAWWGGMAMDLRVGLRQWRRDPGTALLALVTLALGIGATTAVFSLVYGILFRPLPFPEPHRLTALWVDVTERGGPAREWWSFPNLVDVRQEIDAFEEVGIYTGWGPVLTGRGDPTQLQGGVASAGLFETVLGVRPRAGRLFRPDEDVSGGPPVVLVSHGFWEQSLGAREGAVGETLVLDGEAFEVVGVLPEGFTSPVVPGADVWRLVQLDAASQAELRGNFSWRAIARLQPSATVEAAQAELTALDSRLERAFPEHNTGMRFAVLPLRSDLVAEARTGLSLVLAAVALVLLLASANVANLLIARNSARTGAFAVRTALGSSRTRIVRQLLVESSLLVGAGGVLGLGLGWWGTQQLVALAPAGTPRIHDVMMDGRVLTAAVACVVVAALVTGLLPALRADHRGLRSALSSGGTRGSVSSGGRLRSGLVSFQVALAVALLATAGVLTRSFTQLRSVDLGFEPRNVLTFFVGLPGEAYQDRTARAAFMDEMELRLNAIPGAAGVGAVSALPLAGFDGDADFRVEGAPPPEPGREPTAWIRRVTASYMSTMELELVAGRGIEAQDRAGTPPVVVINETLAGTYFPQVNPLGRRLNFGSEEDPLWFEIVGVVRDIRNFGLRDDWRSALYIPNAQFPSGGLFFTLRAAEGVEPVALSTAARAALRELDPNLAATAMEPMEDRIRAALGPDRFLAWLLGGFALSALALAVVGLYGVVSYTVSTRLKELAVRMALGADAGAIRGNVVLRSLLPVVVGLGIGLAMAWIGGRLIASLLFQVSATDPATVAATAGILLLTALLAAGIPAVRASRVDPMKLLREE